MRFILINMYNEIKGWLSKSEAIASCDIVSSPGRDSRDLRSSRLAEATQKALGTNTL